MKAKGTKRVNNFIQRSKAKYGDTFDLSGMKFEYGYLEICIRCKVHDEIIHITPEKHIYYKYGGCTGCKKDSIENEKRDIVLHKGEILVDVYLDGYKDLYYITNYGRCFNKKTGIELTSRKSGKRGYYVFSLRNANAPIGKKSWPFLVHQLVYGSFRKNFTNPKNNKKVIDHKDGNKSNNKLSNLRLITRSANVRYAYKNGAYDHMHIAIRAFDKKTGIFFREFKSITEATKFLGFKHAGPIRLCLNGKRKSSGGYIWRYKCPEVAKQKQNKKVENIDDFLSIGIIDGLDFSKYRINKDSVIINTNKQNRKVNKQYDTADYEVVYLYYTKREYKQFRIHRLLGKMFIDNGETYYADKRYVINHIDKNPKNNALSNLEWVTQRQNTIHSHGKRVAKINPKTNEVIEIFESATLASEEFGELHGATRITYYCRKNDMTKTCYRFKWKYVD